MAEPHPTPLSRWRTFPLAVATELSQQARSGTKPTTTQDLLYVSLHRDAEAIPLILHALRWLIEQNRTATGINQMEGFDLVERMNALLDDGR